MMGTKFRIIYVPEKLPNGFIGMNKLAYEELYNKGYPYSKTTILILRGMNKGRTRRTINHEIIELFLMGRGLKYQQAHKIANFYENNIGLFWKDYKNKKVRY